MEVLSSVWGGQASLIVPFDPVTGQVDSELWRLVSLFDPDVWGHRHTGRALEIDDPEAFNNIVMKNSVGHEHEEPWLTVVRDDLRASDLSGDEPLPSALVSELARHAAPLWNEFDARDHTSST